MAAEWAVELKDVRKTYRTGPIEVPALRGVSLQIAAGEFAATAGPSGSGKTTLLNIIGGLDRADTGEVWVAGQNLQLLSSGELALLRLQRIGFVFQTYNLLPVLTALENAEFTCCSRGCLRASAEKGWKSCFLKSASPALKIVARRNCPADSNNGLPWLAPWLQNPRSFWQMNPRRIWTLPLLSPSSM